MNKAPLKKGLEVYKKKNMQQYWNAWLIEILILLTN